MSPTETGISELVSKIPEGTLICAGGTESLPEGQYIEDYGARENFAVSYAALASEGAVELAMAGSDRALYNSRTLVLGYGRLGKILSARVSAMGARVTVAARREGDLAMAEAMGYDTVPMAALDGKLGDLTIFSTPCPHRFSIPSGWRKSAVERLWWSSRGRRAGLMSSRRRPWAFAR